MGVAAAGRRGAGVNYLHFSCFRSLHVPHRLVRGLHPVPRFRVASALFVVCSFYFSYIGVGLEQAFCTKVFVIVSHWPSFACPAGVAMVPLRRPLGYIAVRPQNQLDERDSLAFAMLEAGVHLAVLVI